MLDEKLEAYLAHQPQMVFSICPICGHKIKAPIYSDSFHDPWWIYPQKAFSGSHVCTHFELMTFSILWTHSEPQGAPWTIPCGWGGPALNESLNQNENLVISLKSHPLPNGATIFWIGLFRHQPNLPLLSDYWPLPVLKTSASIRPSLNGRGYWGEYNPISIHSPVVWSRLFIDTGMESLISYETHKNTGAWLQRIRAWHHLSYTQPMKMLNERFVTESGLASFAIGMRSSRSKGALFISQTPVFKPLPTVIEPDLPPPEDFEPHLQSLTIEQMREFAHTDSLWALLDPFQNEAVQDWLRLIQKSGENLVVPLWRESQLGPGWLLTADSSFSASLKEDDLVNFYRDLSPMLVKVTPEILELSYRYSLGLQSWGTFFVSSRSQHEIHYFLRQHLVCNFQNNWVYFRFYETNFLSVALSTLRNRDLEYFFGPIDGWILRHPSETHHTLYTSTTKHKDWRTRSGYKYDHLPLKIHETAQKVFLIDQPRRVKEFIKERTPEFSNLIPEPVIDRWVRESLRQAHQWGIRKEAHIIKYFLWKVLITPTWCHLPPFVRLLQQPVAEEVKIQNIENLFPQVKLAEIPRGLTIESWDPELWIQLRKHHSPLGNTDPEAFHPLLGERPPAMPLHNPNWMRALGLFYESAYSDLLSQAGVHLLGSVFNPEIQRPLSPPPRLLSLSQTEIVIRDEGQRSQNWLKQHGFESLASTQGNWIHRATNAKAILLAARQFLEEFPYVDSRYIFDFLNQEERTALLTQLDISTVNWDSHHFWILSKMG
jgi:hypothetical protein